MGIVHAPFSFSAWERLPAVPNLAAVRGPNPSQLYPETQAGRDAWIVAHRPNLDRQRTALPVDRPGGLLIEQEPDAGGRQIRTLTVFLTNRECPWRCLMCDLWQHTTLETVPIGAIPRQIDVATASVSGQFGQIKLYNAGSFFDPRAIPPKDHEAIAQRCRGFRNVVVECHPTLIGPKVPAFRDRLDGGRLEVALGLETADPDMLARLNKRMTPDDFARAAGFLRENGIGVRAFLLVKPPFVDDAAASDQAARSVEFAFASGADVVSLIPTRPGNGALDRLAGAGLFTPPTLTLFEEVVDAAFLFRPPDGRVFADLWDLKRFCDGPATFEAREARMVAMNHGQQVLPRIGAAGPSGRRP